MKVLVILAVFCLCERAWLNPAGRLAAFKSIHMRWFCHILIFCFDIEYGGSMPYIPSTRSMRVARHLAQEIQGPSPRSRQSMGPFRGSSLYQRTGSREQDDNNGDFSLFGNNNLANWHSQDYANVTNKLKRSFYSFKQNVPPQPFTTVIVQIHSLYISLSTVIGW